MERLTERFSNGQAAVLACGNNCKYDFKYCNNHLEDCPAINEIYERLALYEDTDLTPEQMKQIDKAYSELAKELAELKKQLPPCKVGDTIYGVHEGTKHIPRRMYECRVRGIKQEYQTWFVKLYADINEENYSIWINDWININRLGVEFFLHPEEAEARLKEMEGE